MISMTRAARGREFPRVRRARSDVLTVAADPPRTASAALVQVAGIVKLPDTSVTLKGLVVHS